MPGSLNIFVLWFLVDSYQSAAKFDAHFALFKKPQKGSGKMRILKKINKLALVAIYKNQKSKICYEAGKSGNIKIKIFTCRDVARATRLFFFVSTK